MPRTFVARAVRRAAPAALLPLAAACVTWQSASGGNAELAQLDPRARVRVLRADGAVYTLTRVSVAGDTLAGDLVAGPEVAPRRVALPLRDVRRVETRQVDPARTAAAVLGGAALAVLAAVGALVAFYLLGNYD